MAYLQYGSYQFAPDSAWFTRHIRPIVGKTGNRNYVNHQWVINGRVSGANTAAVDAARVDFENSLLDGYNLTFSLGTTQNLISSETVSGTHIKELTWLPGYDGVRGSGAEDVFRRTYRLIIDGTFAVTSGNNIIEWHESVVGIGTGGPRVLPVGSLTGLITPQQTQRYTKCEAIQSGYAVGLTAYPVAATPIWVHGVGGVYEYFERRRNWLTTPQQWGVNQNTGFRRNWSYHVWSGAPLVGSPSFF